MAVRAAQVAMAAKVELEVVMGAVVRAMGVVAATPKYTAPALRFSRGQMDPCLHQWPSAANR